MKAKSILLAMLSLICFTLLSSCSDNSEDCPVCVNEFVDQVANVEIIYIADGDSFDFLIQGEQIRIRLLNCDCFETRHTSRLADQAIKAGISEDSAYSLGHLAKAFAEITLFNQQVTIKRDSIQGNMDVYGRLLRHVYIKDSSFADMLAVRGLIVWEN